MKNLIIEDGKGKFTLGGAKYDTLDNITKDDIMLLLGIILGEGCDDFEMDDYDADLITNPAHQIIYRNLHDKFIEVINDKEKYFSDVDDFYREPYEKYKLETEVEESIECIEPVDDKK